MKVRLGGPDIAAIAQRFWTDPSAENARDYLARCGPYYTQQPGNLFDSQRAVRRQAVTTHFIAGEMRSMDLREGLARVACPTLVLGGELDPVCPAACARAIASLIPPRWSRLEMFANAGHGVFRDDPQRALPVLVEFVRGH